MLSAAVLDGSTVLMPARARPADKLKATLRDPELAKQVRSDIAHEIQRRGGAANVIVFDDWF